MRTPHPIAALVLQLITGDPLTRDDRRAIALWLLRLWRQAHQRAQRSDVCTPECP